MKKYIILFFCLFISSVSASASVSVAGLIDLDTELIMDANPIEGVPTYYWYYGCSPTSGGMIMGYWDSYSSGNWANLVEGDVSSWNTTAKNMVASAEHIADYWGNPDPNPEGHEDNCIADFMHTSRSTEGAPDGGTYGEMIPVGLEAFAEWDNPDTLTNEAYYADSWLDGVSITAGTFSWEAFKSEIDAGYPMLLDLIEWHGSSSGWYGHSVVGYGYQEDLFNISIYNGTSWEDITVGGFAIWDTWGTSSSQSSWLGWDDGTVSSYKDANGVEWWPFLDLSLTNGYSYDGGYWDWGIVEGVYFHLGDQIGGETIIPEPATVFLLISGLLGMLFFIPKNHIKTNKI